MGYLLDTNIFIAAFKEHPAVRARLERISVCRQAGISPDTELEVVFRDGEIIVRKDPEKQKQRLLAAVLELRGIGLREEFAGRSADEIMALLRD